MAERVEVSEGVGQRRPGVAGLGREGLALLQQLWQAQGSLVAFLVICLGFALTAPGFTTTENIFNVLRQVAIVGILAVGQTFVVLTAGIDLSVASLLAFCGIVSAWVEVSQVGTGWAVVAALALGALMGLVQGLIITRMGIPAFIVTLGGLSAFRGATLLWNNGYPVIGMGPVYQFFGKGMLGPVPVPVVIFLVVVVLSHLVLTRTKFGRFVYAVGGNPEAARLSGLNVGLVVTAVYVISGLFAGLAGLVLTSRLNAADPVTATGWELNAIAAVVIGGTSLFGGVGSVLGTLLGALIIGVINNGLTLMNVPSYYQQIAVGIIIVLAVWLDHLSKGRARRSRALARHRAGAASAVEKGGDERPSAV